MKINNMNLLICNHKTKTNNLDVIFIFLNDEIARFYYGIGNSYSYIDYFSTSFKYNPYLGIKFIKFKG